MNQNKITPKRETAAYGGDSAEIVDPKHVKVKVQRGDENLLGESNNASDMNLLKNSSGSQVVSDSDMQDDMNINDMFKMFTKDSKKITAVKADKSR